MSAAGLAQGSFTVDAAGQATYELDIRVPPGISGAAPDLALVYRHHAGNGVVGVGWDVGGLSEISRVKATYAVDGFNGEVSYGPRDRFALDGQRLIDVEGDYGAGGTVYATEIQTFQRVEAGATPLDGFRVQAKAGGLAWYGTTEDSRVLTPEKQVRLWALNATEDRYGNRVEYEYTTAPDGGSADSGAHYLRRISYTVRDDPQDGADDDPQDGTAVGRHVDFTYERRPDVIVRAVGGHQITTGFRLASIVVSLGDQVVRTYALHYGVGEATGLSRVEEVVESGAVADGAPALPPTKFTWQDTGSPGFTAARSCDLAQHPGAEPDVRGMDVTGKGRTDLVQFWFDPAGRLCAGTYLATGEGAATGFTHAGDSVLGSFPATHQILPADLNGDGRTDLVVAYAAGPHQALKLAVFRSTGTGFTADGNAFDTGDTWDVKHLRFFAMDVNGDGRTDIVEVFKHHDPERGDLLALRCYLADSGGTFAATGATVTDDPAELPGELGFWPVDLTGNGAMDLARAWRSRDNRITVASYLAASTALDHVAFDRVVHSDLGTFAVSNQIALLPVDVNGDGTQDLLQIWQRDDPAHGTTELHLSTFLPTGDGGFTAGPDSVFPGQSLTPGQVYPMDVDGSGATAIVGRWQSRERIMFTPFRASPSGQYRLLPSFPGEQAGPDANWSAFLPADVNADGKADLIRLHRTGQQQVRATAYVSTGDHPDVVSTITDQLGRRTAIGYAPLSDPAVYTQDEQPAFPATPALRYPGPITPTAFPAQAVLGGAILVVADYTETTDPTRNRFACTARHTLSYRNALADLTGRGWLGFAESSVTDEDAGLLTTTKRHQGFPLTGMPSSVGVQAVPVPGGDPRVPPGSPPLLLVETSYEYQPTGTALPVVLPSAIREARFDYGADRFDRATAHRFGYDEFGNQVLDADLGHVDRTTGQPLDPARVVYRHRLFHNDSTPSGWALGHLLAEKVSRNADEPDIHTFRDGDLRLRQHTLAPGTGAVIATADWDDTARTFLTTTYDHDEFGNVVSRTPPGGQPTRHEYEPGFHTYPMRTTGPPDAQGRSLVQTFGYDPRTGAAIVHTDTSGQVWVHAADPFGRSAARQAPVTDGETGDPNQVSTFVTGTPELVRTFREAKVVTIEQTAYRDDGRSQVIEVRSLQSFPDSTARDLAAVRSAVDSRGRVRQTVRESGQRQGDVVVLTDYDTGGRPVSQTLPFFAATPVVTAPQLSVRISYDVLGRRIAQHTPTGPDGAATTTTTWYHGRGGVVTETAAAGSPAATVRQLTTDRFDGTERVRLAVADPDGLAATTTFEYDPLGRLLSVTDPPTSTNPEGVRTTATYDSLDRRTSHDCPDQNPDPRPGTAAVRFEYDPGTGLLRRRTDAAGAHTEFTYDHLHRLTGTHLSDGRVVERGYGTTATGNGRLTTVVTRDAGSVESGYEFAYDVRGNSVRTTLTIDGEPAAYVVEACFDPQRRVVRRTLPDGSVESSTYAYSRLVSQSLAGARVDRPLDQHDALGRPTELRYGGTASEAGPLRATYTRGPTGLRYGETLEGPTGRLLDLSCGYDPLGRLTHVDDALDAGQSAAFGYRDQRLVRARHGEAVPSLFEYDESGNLRGRDGITYDYRAHFARGGASGGEFVYRATQDRCGRTATRTADGSTLRFDYDGHGVPRAASDPAGVVLTLLTGPDGRVLRASTPDGTSRVFLDDTYQVTRSPDGRTTVERRLVDDTGSLAVVSGPVAAPEVTYVRHDHKGSTTHVFGTDGGLRTHLRYDPYGRAVLLTGTAMPEYGYEGRRWLPEVGLYDFGGRFYDPAHGCFLTPDPGPGAADPYRSGAYNRFAFELGDPVNLIDPSGYSASSIAGFVIGGVLVIGGIAVVVASGGFLAPVVTAGWGAWGVAALTTAGYAAIGAGVNGIGFSLGNQDTSAGGYWLGFVASAAVGAALGGLTAGTSAGVGAGLTRFMAARAITSRAVQSSVRLAAYTAYGAAGGGTVGVVGQFAANVIGREIVGQDVGLGDGLWQSAVFGGAVGGLIGLASGSAEVAMLRRAAPAAAPAPAAPPAPAGPAGAPAPAAAPVAPPAAAPVAPPGAAQLQNRRWSALITHGIGMAGSFGYGALKTGVPEGWHF